MLTYRVTPENDLMQVYNGEDMLTLGVRLSPDAAALFAASPKMLAALKLALRNLDDCCWETEHADDLCEVEACAPCRVRAAIAEATLPERLALKQENGGAQ